MIMSNILSIKDPKINPYSFQKDGLVSGNDAVETGPTNLAYAEWEKLQLELPNMQVVREYRLARLQSEMRKRNIAGLTLFDPLNIRYATGTSNMQVWTTHNPARACFVPAEGKIILWDFHNCSHLSAHLPLIEEVRHGASFFYFETGDRSKEKAIIFAKEIAQLMKKNHVGSNICAIDRMEMLGIDALREEGVQLVDGQEVTEIARSIKCQDEVKAMICSLRACEASMKEMQEQLQAGISENELWSYLHAGNIKRGGEWIETRLLSSGPRTNPWFQESGPRIIQEGDIVAFDTDLVGCYGMCADISRTWKAGSAAPTEKEKMLYQIAHEHIQQNMSLLKPKRGFMELSALAHRLPVAYREQRYGVIYHGVGLCDEYPCVRYPEDVASSSYDGELEAGMVICVEAYVGDVGGGFGIKLEEQVLITDTGYKNLTQYPFEDSFLT